MKQIVEDKKLIAHCGLYCGACRKFLQEKCPACHYNAKASWCQIRTCNIEHNYATCAECKEFSNPMDCKKYNNFFSKVMGFVFRSDRNECITFIKQNGLDNFANYMTHNKIMVFKKE